MTFTTKPLADGVPFGVRVGGLTRSQLDDAGIRRRLVQLFEAVGLIVFEDVEQSSEMQLAISDVFGPLKEHPVKNQAQVAPGLLPGVIELAAGGPDMATVEIDGKPLTSWNPWHFDHCYTAQLNRAGVLRPVELAPEGGLTAFADGVQIWQDLPEDLKAQVEHVNVVYALNPLFEYMRFGRPANFRELKPQRRDVLETARDFPRAIHPAVWARASGEKVVHFAPWMAFGVEGREDEAGDALLTELWDAIRQVMKPYIHTWDPGDMLIWDNWRLIHEAMGCDPGYRRVMHRTTIAGDYGLGRSEQPGVQGREPTVVA